MQDHLQKKLKILKNKARVIAFYLPQFHQIKENDEWWGEGFTEWTLVKQAKPLFQKHYQPRIPSPVLGYYDLLNPETREKQAEIASEHGIEGFCYWHYWLGNGRKMLEKPIEQVLDSGKPNFPFCLGWANHDWKGKFFGSKKTLAIQLYPGNEDFIEHFNHVLRAFKDPRYIRVQNKPIFYIYRPKDIPNCKEFIDLWQSLAHKSGLKGIHFIGEGIKFNKKENFGLDAVSYTNHRVIESKGIPLGILKKIISKLNEKRLKVYDYNKASKYFINSDTVNTEGVYPSIIAGWDTTARLGNRALILKNYTPKGLYSHSYEVMKSVEQIKFEKRIVFIKSWNEWSEGNYLEPDEAYDFQYLKALKNAITN